MSENAEQSRGPAIEDVVRYFDGEMQPKEVLAFERQAEESEEFAQQIQAIWEILEALETAGERVDRPAVQKEIERIVADERQIWWRERLRQAVDEIAARGVRVAALATEGVDAAFEVTMRTAAGAVVRGVDACVNPSAGFEFGYSVARAARRTAAPGSDPPEDASTGFFRAGEFSGSVRSDASRREVSVTFLGAPPEAVFLLPEDASAGAQEAECEPAGGTEGTTVIFRNVPEGRYLIVVPGRLSDERTTTESDAPSAS